VQKNKTQSIGCLFKEVSAGIQVIVKCLVKAYLLKVEMSPIGLHITDTALAMWRYLKIQPGTTAE
jgi:hypothetical protein